MQKNKKSSNTSKKVFKTNETGKSKSGKVPKEEFSKLSKGGTEGRRRWYIYSKYPPLSSTHPELAAQWHPTKNGPWKPTEFSFGSAEKVWWKCPRGDDHVWLRAIFRRTSSTGKFYACPFCEGYKVSKTNSLATLFPQVAKEWHPTKNGKLTPQEVGAKSTKRVWWKCPKGSDHVWQAHIDIRTRVKHNCPFCSGHMVSKTNSLASKFPHIADQWHKTKNGTLKPNMVTAFSKKRVWWQCSIANDHVWQTVIESRTFDNTECPFCKNKRPSKKHCLTVVNPGLAAEWHEILNGELTPSLVTPNSNKRAWWRCKNNENHVWKTSINNRNAGGTSCPYCSGKRRIEPQED